MAFIFAVVYTLCVFGAGCYFIQKNKEVNLLRTLLICVPVIHLILTCIAIKHTDWKSQFKF